MRIFDDYGLKLCRFQGELFVESIEKTKCSSPIFLRRFMYSNAAQRMDSEGFLFESTSQTDIINEINTEFGESDFGKIKYDSEEMYWIGYIYRYWCYTHELSSKKVFHLMKPTELRKLYFPYHSLDPEQAVDRIIEANSLNEDDYIAQGVKLLRKLKQH